jgi:tetratricopeptide (TPR) repeat protein/tRNA A-37 threonylcarbamoyl transferase component Bud32
VTSNAHGSEQRLDEVLAEYLKAAAAGRAPRRGALLDDHPDLAAELASFLDDRECFDRLAAPLRSLASRLGLPPGTIDGYELEAEIARGGMGVVYRARQCGLNRTVALKMLRSSALAAPGQLRRFQAEAEAVAALDHRGIVPVYEVGDHGGQPFLAMKYMEGGSLAGGLDRYREDQRESARLLAEVAEAVDHAHRHGVLHRDLKPANILLDAEGRPHVSDFGLAKRLSPAGQQNGAAGLTQTGDLLGTPSYMAPEQARGDQRAVTVATDVYGLGAILYELLTGKPPFVGDGILDTLNRIRDQAPVPPRQLRPGVDRDLETICLKALEKEPAERYPSVQALADDLHRFLAGEPVHARPVGLLRRGWRWCRRRRALAGLLLALGLALAAGFVGVTWQWRRAERHARQEEQNYDLAEAERQRAEANLDKAAESFRQAHEAVDEFCVRLSDKKLSVVSGSHTLRRDLLQAGLRYYEQFVAREGDDPRLRAELAGVYRRLGALNASIGKRDEALAALQRSRKILEEELPATPRQQGDLGRTNLQIALLQVSNGQLTAALTSLGVAEKELKYASESSPDDVKDAADFASVLLDKAMLCSRLGRLDESRACYKRQIDLLSQLSPRFNNRPDLKADLAAGYVNLGGFLVSLGQHEEAAGAFEKASALLEPLARSASANDRYRGILAICLLNLGSEQFRGNHAGESLRTLERARSLLEKLADANPDVLQYSRDLSACLRQTGHVHRVAGRPAEALKCYDKARSIMERLVRLDEASAECQNDLAKCLFDLAGLQARTGKDADAILNTRAAAEIRKKLVAAEPANLFFRCDLGLTLGNVAGGFARQGQIAEAREAAREAAEHHRAAFTGAPQVAIFRKYLAGACGRVAELALRAGDVTEVVAVSRERRELSTADAAQLYACACDFARAAALAVKRDSVSSPDAREYEGLALDTLGLAVRAGFKDADKMRKDTALAKLRGRPGFEKLLTECSK